MYEGCSWRTASHVEIHIIDEFCKTLIRTLDTIRPEALEQDLFWIRHNVEGMQNLFTKDWKKPENFDLFWTVAHDEAKTHKDYVQAESTKEINK